LAASELKDTESALRFWNSATMAIPEPSRQSYFQALALRRLENHEAATAVLVGLRDFAEKRSRQIQKIDYFATSLPNLLLFEDDLEKRNQIECQFLIALASDGLGDSTKASAMLREVIAEDPNHLWAINALRWIESGTETTEREARLTR
jgi:hypothetical protein